MTIVWWTYYNKYKRQYQLPLNITTALTYLATLSNRRSISGLDRTKECSQKLGSLISPIKVASSPQGCGRLTISLSRRILQERCQCHPCSCIRIIPLPCDLFLCLLWHFLEKIQDRLTKELSMAVRITQMICHSTKHQVGSLSRHVIHQVHV